MLWNLSYWMEQRHLVEYNSEKTSSSALDRTEFEIHKKIAEKFYCI